MTATTLPRGYSGRTVDDDDRVAAITACYLPGGRLGPDRCPPSGRPADTLTPATAQRPDRIPPGVWDRMPWHARYRADDRHRPTSAAATTITTTREDAA